MTQPDRSETVTVTQPRRRTQKRAPRVARTGISAQVRSVRTARSADVGLMRNSTCAMYNKLDELANARAPT